MTEPDPLLERLLAKDETAFKALVRRHHGMMVSIARSFVGSHAIAEEVAQDAWLAVIDGLPRFEGRSTLKNWIFAILANKARTRAEREGRIPDFTAVDSDPPATVDPDGFAPDGSWAVLPVAWEELDPERIVAGRQLMAHVADLLDSLPAAQRSVVVLRDFEGLEPEDARRILGVSEANQRVLLHRGRSRIRNGLMALLARSPDQGHIAQQRSISKKVNSDGNAGPRNVTLY